MSETPGTTRRSRREAPTEDAVVEESRPRRAPRAEKAEREPRAPRPPREPKAPREPRGKAAAPRPTHRPGGVRPSVLLIPPPVIEARARRVLVRRLGLGVGAVAAVSALAVGGAAALGAAAERDLESAGAENATLTSEAAQLQPVADYYDGLDTTLTETYDALVADVSYATALESIEGARPDGVTITSESTDGAAGEKCAGPNPFDPAPAIGCVSIEGTADTLEGAVRYAALLDDYVNPTGGSDVLVDAFVTSNVGRDGVFTFSMTVNYNASAYSQKYVNLVPEEQRDTSAAPVDDETAE